jgi:phospholipid transport system substrate-binding protein
MKFLTNILKAFLINFCFIGIIFASDSCPSISPKNAEDNPTAQVKAIINDVVCSFIELQSDSNGALSSALNLTKKKILPYIDLEYSTKLALSDYWDVLDLKERKIFERDIKNSLIDEYVGILTSLKNWEDFKITVSDDYIQNENFAKVKVKVALDSNSSSTGVILKLIRKNRWKIYDLEYQSISILDIEKMGYTSKIQRKGIKNLIQKMLSKT